MYPTEGGTAPAEPAPPRKSRAPLVIGIVAVVLLVCCGGGVAAYLLSDKGGTSGSGGGSGQEEVEGNLDQFKTGDCLTIDAAGKVKKANCTDAGAFRVVLRKDGTTSETACDSTDATQTLTADGPGTKDDLILCIKPAAT